MTMTRRFWPAFLNIHNLVGPGAPAGAALDDSRKRRSCGRPRPQGHAFCNLLFPALVLAVVFASIAPLAAADAPEVQLNADKTTGRTVEELTRKAVARDYASAWRTLAQALNNNDAGVLENDFVGIAQEKLQSLVADQLKAGLRTRYIDHGHNLDVLFYSPEGSSIQVRDTAHLEIQVLDGDKLIHSEQVTQHYISLLTPTEVRWKVRLLQAVPGQ